MDTTDSCFSCFLRQGEDLTDSSGTATALRERIQAEIHTIIEAADLSRPPVVVGQAIHRRIRQLLADPDPYLPAKRQFGRLVEEMLPELRVLVERSETPLLTAARLAIAANIIDLGVHGDLTPDAALGAVRNFADRQLAGDPADFQRALASATRVLYLADNAGEILADRLLIEQIGPERVTLAVRGGPVINDVTLEDARACGLCDLVPVIDNGSDAPGTLLDDCSEEFRTYFESADLIIAKGQGNFETLVESKRPIFFLFTVKCQRIAEQSGLSLGTAAMLPGSALTRR